MDLSHSAEQEELRRVVRAFFLAASPEAEVRRLMADDDGWDPAVWSRMAKELGLQGLAVPERYGGQGFGFQELAIVLEEMGRALVCAPFLSTAVLATHLLIRTGGATAEELLPRIAVGDLVATVAIAEESGGWDGDGLQAVATSDGPGWRLDGTKCYVLDGNAADVVLVVARAREGLTVFRVDAGADGMARTPVRTADPTRRQARIEFRSTPATLVGELGAGGPVLSYVLQVAAIALAAEQLGGAERVLEMAVEYATVRVQFGRPIGSFQAVKHRCAEMLVDVERARSAVGYAAWCAAEQSDDLPVVASLAKATCSEAFSRVAADNILIHGGIGFTWEHPAHLYLKRAKSSELLFRDATYHRELLAEYLGL